MSSLTDLFHGMQLKFFISLNQIFDMVHVKEVQKYFKKCLPALGHTCSFIQSINVSYRLTSCLPHCTACGILTSLPREGSDLAVRVPSPNHWITKGFLVTFSYVSILTFHMSTKRHTADLRNVFRIPKLVYGTWIFFWCVKLKFSVSYSCNSELVH